MQANLNWDALTGGYKLKFEDIKRYDWEKVKLVIGALKQLIPSGYRDYDDVEKIWYIDERYFTSLKLILKANFSNVNIFEKPADAASTTKFVPTEQDLTTFVTLLGNGHTLDSIKTVTFHDANKLYRKAAMTHHPDRNGGNGENMSRLNEAWARLKERHVFKEAGA